ncbi:unnamed protein product [Ceratitis capitata]|uniref:(Mediterranean fruit fly) hypothetical protein n=1 Tax=Ceratitis capitata TaxID=7213 RepID=A0A811VFC7_CERCA|nr:unnamed protein product [Ceratitis capitata]
MRARWLTCVFVAAVVVIAAAVVVECVCCVHVCVVLGLSIGHAISASNDDTQLQQLIDQQRQQQRQAVNKCLLCLDQRLKPPRHVITHPVWQQQQVATAYE